MFVTELEEYRPEQVFHDHLKIHRYIHSGRGEVALIAPTGKCHIYRFSRPDDPAEFPDGYIFCYIMHEDRRIYVGLLEKDGSFRTTRRSQVDKDTEAFRGAQYICMMAVSQDLVDRTPMKLVHTGKCCKCGRKLTSSKALREGIGKSCKRKLITCGK